VRQAERQAAAAAHRMSETLQRSLLTEPPQPAGLQIAVRYRPAAREAQVGGDWYDAFLCADGVPALAIGDVAGHDRDAAAAMGQVRNLLRGIAYTLSEPPAAVLSALDRALRDLAVGSLATAVFARLLPTEGGARLLRWSNGGHPPPLVLEADGSVHLLRHDPDLLLGLDPATARGDHDRVLRPGATLLLYTDGLVERREASIDDGLARLAAVVASLADARLEDLCDLLLERLGHQREDDVALLAVRVLPTG
jgi:serine phosphatase RsbU (regulator of sigma subunit)